MAVAGDLVFVAANNGSLQVIDARDPRRPVQVHRDSLFRFPAGCLPQPEARALQGTRAYVATRTRLHIIDITAPLAPTFPADINLDGVSDVILRSIDFPRAVATQRVRAVAVQGDFAYVLTNDPGAARGRSRWSAFVIRPRPRWCTPSPCPYRALAGARAGGSSGVCASGERRAPGLDAA